MKLKRVPNSFQNTNSAAATNTNMPNARIDATSASGANTHRPRAVSGVSQTSKTNGSATSVATPRSNTLPTSNHPSNRWGANAARSALNPASAMRVTRPTSRNTAMTMPTSRKRPAKSHAAQRRASAAALETTTIIDHPPTNLEFCRRRARLDMRIPCSGRTGRNYEVDLNLTLRTADAAVERTATAIDHSPLV